MTAVDENAVSKTTPQGGDPLEGAQAHEMAALELETALEAAEEQRDYLLEALDRIAGQRPTGRNDQRVLHMASIAAEAVGKVRGPEPYTDEPPNSSGEPSPTSAKGRTGKDARDDLNTSPTDLKTPETEARERLEPQDHENLKSLLRWCDDANEGYGGDPCFAEYVRRNAAWARSIRALLSKPEGEAGVGEDLSAADVATVERLIGALDFLLNAKGAESIPLVAKASAPEIMSALQRCLTLSQSHRRLREALEPFAKRAEQVEQRWGEGRPARDSYRIDVRLGDCRAARALLSALPEEQGK